MHPSLAALLLVFLSIVPSRIDGDREDVVAEGHVERRKGLPEVGAIVPRSAPGGHAYVSLLAFSRPLESGARDFGGMIVVGLPFDRMARVAGGRSLAEPPHPPPPRARGAAPPRTPPPSPSPSPS
ncbi:MAG TPA: hypothetical protein VIF62_00590, partial [Labilithrix sp.]